MSSSDSATAAAVTRLNELINEIQQNQNPKTLACWRLSNNPNLVDSLHEFAAAAEAKKKAADNNDGEVVDSDGLLDEVQTFFRDELNPLLAEQENSSEGKAVFSSTTTTSSIDDDYGSLLEDEISVVFGGKYSKNPSSISEVLVSKLLEEKKSPHVITVSRSNVWVKDLPSSNNLTHISKQNLDSDDKSGIGVEEFTNVINFTICKAGSQKKSIAFYFTLGQHKGFNPFNRNIQAATNFAQALEKTIGGSDSSSSAAEVLSWRVVLTGTDATLPSTYPDGKVSVVDDDDNNNKEEYVVPTYKIMKYNYTYAMSKLGQYYIILRTIAKLVGDKNEIVNETTPIIEKIIKHVSMVGEDGDYHPDKSLLIQMEELDMISNRIVELSNELHDHFWIATGISICYTPLHAKPWTEAALSTDCPKGYIIEQIVRRLKNAISIERAANLHFPPLKEL